MAFWTHLVVVWITGQVLIWTFGFCRLFIWPGVSLTVVKYFLLTLRMVWSWISYLQIFIFIPVLSLLFCLLSLMMGEILYLLPLPYLVFFHTCTQLTSQPFVYISWEGVPLGVVVHHFLVPYVPWFYWRCGLNFFPFIPFFYVFIVYLPEKIFLQNSVYFFMIVLSVQYVSIHCYSHGTISARVSGVPWGGCFPCGV